MKKNVFKLLAVMLVGIALVTGCKKDDDDPILPPPGEGGDKVELANGYYVYSGDIATLKDIPANGLMKVTKNENGQTERASLYETHYMFDQAKGFFLIKVTNGAVDYISSADVAKKDALNEEPTAGLWKGSTGEDSTKYSVDASGPYHIAYDSDLDSIVFAKADWGIIGAASPNGWDGNTAFPYKESDDTKIVWEGTEIAMKTGGFKLRYADGWKIFFGDVTGTEVVVNCNLGGTLDALEPGGSDMNFTEPGIYTMTLTFTYGTGFTIVATKTADAAITDWSAVAFDVFGTGVAASNGTAVDDASAWAWGKAVAADNSGLPTKDGLVYTYKWTDVALENADGEGFGLRSVVGGDTYNGTVYRYDPVDSLRTDFTAVGPTTNGFGDVNINVLANGNFDVYLVIDAGDKDAAKFTIVETGSYFGDVWSIIGDATPAEWNDNQMIPNADGTEWTFTGDLVEGAFKFRKNGDWAEQIGWNGTAWYFDGNADAYAIANGEDGNYTVVLDSSTPDATVTKN